HYRSPQQRDELIAAFQNLKAAGDLDYVAAWYIKAVQYLKGDDRNADLLAGLGGAAPKDRVKIAFVSTNSITQGEQVPVLWPELFRHGVHIHFAHRTFQWSNEASGVAAVHCVIIGFASWKSTQCALFEYTHPRGEAHMQIVTSISPYLTAGPEMVISKRQQPLNPQLPIMRCGNKPSDGGYLLLTPEERIELSRENPAAGKFIRRYVGSEEFINNIERYCLWLTDASPNELRAMPAVMRRVEAVRKFRAASSAEPTRKSAQTPTRFFFVSQPDQPYILIPEVSSERRPYIPIGLMPPDVITSNTNYITTSGDMYIYGILQSSMHMAWMRGVAGRLKSDYRYSGTMVYNTFP
ncbi:MAG: type IIL restriction-modification enzyme MmeI, partial [Gammaproteobacteria bacterium]